MQNSYLKTDIPIDTGNKIDFLNDVLDLLPTPIYIKNRDHLWVQVNQAFCDFLGYPSELLIGKSDFDVTPEEQSQVFWEMDDFVLTTQKTSVNIETTTNNLGEKRWVESVKSYYEDSNGDPYIIGVLTDITELKNREEALIIAEQKARKAAKIKSEFLANMSHEIRTPMNGVLGMTSVLQGTELSAKQTEIVSIIERSADSLLDIINDILDFSKMETGKFKIDKAPFQLNDVINDVAALLGVTANSKGIELVIDLEDETPKILLGDSGRLRQILINLIGNGIKFTEKGYVVLTVKSRFDKFENKKYFDFFIRDTGIGIEAEKLSSIFNEFEQVDGSTTREAGGTGLGLSISKNLVSLMGGDLSVKSDVGQGSLFFFTICLPYDDDLEVKDTYGDTSIDLTGRRALIVDDLDVNLSVLKSNLERHSLHIDQAKSAVEATQLLKNSLLNKTPYDIIITDYLMPKVDGLSFVKALRKSSQFKSIPITVLTSVDTVECQEGFKACNVEKYLVKPVKNEKLIKEIASILPQRTIHQNITTPNKSKPDADLVNKSTDRATRLLLAEDNHINRNVVQMSLTPAGYELDCANNGAIAFELFQENTYDLVLMDISMPVMDGILATEAIRKYETENNLKRTPIMALTAHSFDEDKIKFLKAGMDDVLSKPLRAGDLVAKVESLIPAKEKS